MKKNLQFPFTALLIFLTTLLTAQKPPAIIKGMVVEASGQRPIEFATVMVKNKQTQEVVAGVTTDDQGDFMIKTPNRSVSITVSFIGFVSQTFEDISFEEGVANLGQIVLSEDSETLDEVVVRAEKSSTEFKLDKRVFNVGKDLSSTGAGALEVLNNVPSVSVNIEGQVSLRGSSGVQILINGKPSVLANEQGNALGSITADMIDRIEVITNPSAKYEAEGTSGIINIVIKKEERKGFNGSVSVNTGIPHNHSVGLSLNRRTEKFNLFSQFGVGYRELPRDNESINQDLIAKESIISEGKEFRNELFYNVILGTDYHINKLNVLTLSGNFALEIEDQPSDYNFKFLDDNTGNTLAEWNRSEVTEATNPKYRYELQYKKDFPDNEDHNLLFSVLGNFFGKDQSSDFVNIDIIGNRSGEDQQTFTNFKEAKYTFNLDYTRPFNDKFTIEVGGQYVRQDVSNDFSVSNKVGDSFIADPGLTNLFEYDQNVLGIYGTGAYEYGKWGIKLGARLENTDLKTLLVNTTQRNSQNFTNLFPSLHTSYKVSDQFSFQAGYSRRIYRPRLWDLNPFFNVRNTFSIRTGNPDLQPEYTDSYEVVSIYIFDKSSLNFGVYHRYTTEVIESISTFTDGVNVYTPENIGTKKTTGVEFNGKYSPNKWLTLNGEFNYNYFKRDGVLEGTIFDFSADQWSSEMTAKFKFPAQIDFEVTGEYQSKYQTVQGEVSDNLFANLGLRKKILKGKVILNLSVRDVFASRVRESITTQPDFYLYNWGRRGRFVTFGVSYGFGKGEAMEYSGRRRR